LNTNLQPQQISKDSLQQFSGDGDMGRPKIYDFPPFMTFDGDRGGFVVRNPITGKRKRFRDQEVARSAAHAMTAWVANERKNAACNKVAANFGPLAQQWLIDQLPYQPWAKGTIANNRYIFLLIARELGGLPVASTTPMDLADWLNRHCKTTDLHIKHRNVLITLYEFAISRGVDTENQARKILKRSGSKKLVHNRKVRQPLHVIGFRSIHSTAPPWLQLAMELSLLTLQARTEVCHMRHEHFRDGHLFVIRDKVSGESDMAFIKIKLTAELEALRNRALMLDAVLSPFLVHRAPERRQRRWMEGKPHWTYVLPHFLSQSFEKARTRAKVYEGLPVMQRPTFHEIRGLGSRLARSRGVPKEAIQALMTHSSPKTTAIYLDGGTEALTDSDYVSVATPMSLAELLRT
jgi:integrase